MMVSRESFSVARSGNSYAKGGCLGGSRIGTFGAEAEESAIKGPIDRESEVQ